MRSSMRRVQAPDNFAQSEPSGTRPRGQFRKLLANFLERHANSLGKHDERNPPQYSPWISAVT